VQADLGRVEAADIAAEGEKLDTARALVDVPVEAVGADVVGREEVPDAVRALVGRADAFGLGPGRPAPAARLRLQFKGPNSSKQITTASPASASA
jgi:hypothetical protein